MNKFVVGLFAVTACTSVEGREPPQTENPLPPDITVDEPDDPKPPGPSTTLYGNDCDTAAGYQLDSYAQPGGHLRIVGIYESRNSDAPWWADPACAARLDECAAATDPAACNIDDACDRSPHPHAGQVRVRAGGATTLVLASYEPTDWTITVDPGAQLDKVVLSSSYPTTAIVPAGVIVEHANLGYAYEWYTDAELAQRCEDVESADYCAAIGDYWYQQRQDAAAQTAALVSAAQSYTHETLGTFDGCYSMSSIALE